MGAAAVGATIYFGSDQSGRQIVEVAQHSRTRMSWVWPRCCGAISATMCSRSRARTARRPIITSRRSHRPGQSFWRDDPSGHHQAEAAGEQRRFQGAEHGQFQLWQIRRADLHRADQRIHPIDLCRYQVANCYMGRAGSSTAAAHPRQGRPGTGPLPPPSSNNAPAAWA